MPKFRCRIQRIELTRQSSPYNFRVSRIIPSLQTWTLHHPKSPRLPLVPTVATVPTPISLVSLSVLLDSDPLIVLSNGPSNHHRDQQVSANHQECEQEYGHYCGSASDKLTLPFQELESLLEKGLIDEAAFDNIHAALPAELPLRGAGAANTTTSRSANATPVAPPTQAFQNLNVNSQSPAPPSYDNTPPPTLPSRNAKPIVAHARALYRYAGTDARDLSLEKDDKVLVHEYMNQDWWMGQNTRTGLEGIFPRNYVFVEEEQKTAYPQQPSYGYPNTTSQGPPAQQNPYNAHVPPMAVSEGGQPSQGDGKMGEYGKKFGKKLGNAAIFGAGASIGGKIVNGIF